VAWWLDLADDPPYAVQLIEGDPDLIAVWGTPQEVRFYAQTNGAEYGRLAVNSPATLNGTAWREFLDTLRAPNGACLPVVEAANLVIHTSHDGRFRVYQEGGKSLVLDLDGHRVVLDRSGEATFVTVGLDRELGTLAAVDADKLLHIYQQHVYVGAFPLTIQGDPHDWIVLLPDWSDTVIVATSGSIQRFELAGQLAGLLELPAEICSAAISPDGRWIVTADRHQPVLRVYDSGFHLICQENAWTLWSDTPQVQLLAAAPFMDARPGSLAAGRDGTLVFSLGGGLCVTHIDRLTPVPQPRTLF
jgi:hypothetical protein